MAINSENIDNIKSNEFDWISGRASCQIGGRATNQDAWGAVDTPYGFLVVVCDGMGGGPAGEIASKVAVDNILHHVKTGSPDESRMNIVIKAIRMANEAIIKLGLDNPMYQGMGSTCIVLLINQQSAVCAYVGDSRIYQLQGTHKKWRTFDHSMVFGLVRHGVITEEQARLSAQSNVITRALGIKLDVEVDAFELPFEKGDRFVLTTDGLHGSMPEPKLIERMANHKDPMNMVVDNLVKEVEQIGESTGGQHDNHTIAMVDVKKNSILKEKMSKKTKLIILCLGALLVLSIALNIILLCSNKDDSKCPTVPIESEYEDAIDASYTHDSLRNGFSASTPDEAILDSEAEAQAEADQANAEAAETAKAEEAANAATSAKAEKAAPAADAKQVKQQSPSKETAAPAKAAQQADKPKAQDLKDKSVAAPKANPAETTPATTTTAETTTAPEPTATPATQTAPVEDPAEVEDEPENEPQENPTTTQPSEPEPQTEQ